MKILSIIPMVQLCAGTKEPICAIRAMIAVCRIYVDLPAILGPVITAMRLSVQSSEVSLGTKREWESTFSTTGCLPSRISSLSPRLTSGFVYLFLTAASASE